MLEFAIILILNSAKVAELLKAIQISLKAVLPPSLKIFCIRP